MAYAAALGVETLEKGLVCGPKCLTWSLLQANRGLDTGLWQCPQPNTREQCLQAAVSEMRPVCELECDRLDAGTSPELAQMIVLPKLPTPTLSSLQKSAPTVRTSVTSAASVVQQRDTMISTVAWFAVGAGGVLIGAKLLGWT